MPSQVSSSNKQLRAQARVIYDHYRTVCMSRHYYASRLILFKRYNLTYEVALAVSTSGAFVAWYSSSPLSAWYFWQTPAGNVVRTSIAGLVVLLAILKPFLPFSEKIEKYSKLFIGYSDLYYDLKEIVDSMKTKESITKKVSDALSKAQKRYKDLALQDDPKPSKRLLRKCQNEVNRRFPASDFWYPQL